MTRMYSLNDMTNGFVKMKPQGQIPSNGASNQMVLTGDVSVVKEQRKDATCSMVGQKFSPSPPMSGYPETSLGEINNQNDVMNIQISNIQGALSFQHSFKNETIKTGDQLKNQLNKLPSSDELQLSFDYRTQDNLPMAQEHRDRPLGKHTFTQKEMYPEGTELRSPINQSSFHPLPVYQMSTNGTMPSHQKLSPLLPKSDYTETSRGEISDQNNVINIQISNIQGASSFQNGFKDETIKTDDQIENQLNKLPLTDELQSRFDYSTQENMPMAQEHRDGQPTKQTITQKEMYPEETELRSPINQSSFRPLPVYQMSSNGTLPCHQFDTQNDSTEIGSSCRGQMGTNLVAPPNMSSNTTVPLRDMDTQEEITAFQIGDMQIDTRHQAPNYQPQISFLHGSHNSHEFFNEPKFNEKQIYDPRPNCNRRTSYQCCQCCCRSPTQNEPYYVSPVSLENQRPSVIMVPVSWSNIASGTSHMPFKVGSPYLLPSQNPPYVTNGVGYRNDSDSSDEDDDERQVKYFRLNIDRTTARFKLTREDWERIPINTLPSGGRLLSGDWTKIFLEKVKESNPWCSLRFKRNHVRSENSRKINSVFFRGGAECKRPECNVKVRFIIQKENGTFVDVTYVGNVCHSSQPDGGNKNGHRVCRTYTFS